MKIFHYLSFLFVVGWLSILNAQTSQDEIYKKALSAYKSKDYKDSYKLLSRLYLEKLSDVNINFMLGRSAFETGHYEMALAAFERVEMLDPQNLRNKVEMAQTYFMLKMYEDAELKFKEVLENPNIPKNVRTNIEFYLSRVTKAQQKSFTYGNVGVERQYDSNVNFGQLDNQYNISLGTIPATPEAPDDATFYYATLTNLYDMGAKRGFVVKNKFIGAAKHYDSLKDYNTN